MSVRIDFLNMIDVYNEGAMTADKGTSRQKEVEFIQRVFMYSRVPFSYDERLFRFRFYVKHLFELQRNPPVILFDGDHGQGTGQRRENGSYAPGQFSFYFIGNCHAVIRHTENVPVYIFRDFLLRAQGFVGNRPSGDRISGADF